MEATTTSAARAAKFQQIAGRQIVGCFGVFVIAIQLGTLAVRGEEPAEDSSAAAHATSYYKEVRPIFQAHCQGCHQPAKPGGEYVMTSYDALLRGGESESTAIVAGKPEASHLVEMITPVDGESEMPRDKKPLSSAEIETITGWIAQGAVDDTPAAAALRFDKDHPPAYTAPPVITSLAFSPDGKWLVVSGFYEVLIHQADGSALVDRLIGLSARIEAIAFSPDGKRLAVCGGLPARMGEVQIWNLDERALELSVPVTYDTVYGASWSPDGRYVAFGCADNSVRSIDAETGEQVLHQRAPNDWTLDTTFSVDGSHLVSVGRDRTAKLIEFKTARFVDNITSITPGALKGGILAVDRHPSRDEIVVGGDDGVVRTYRMHRESVRRIGDDGNLIRRFPVMPGRIFDVAFNYDGTQIVAGSSQDGHGAVYVFSSDYDSSLPEEIKKIEEKAVAGRSAEERKQLETYHESDVRILAKMAGQHGGVFAVAVQPDGKVVASGGYDGLVRLNDASTGALIREFVPVPVESEPVTSNDKVAQQPRPSDQQEPTR